MAQYRWGGVAVLLACQLAGCGNGGTGSNPDAGSAGGLDAATSDAGLDAANGNGDGGGDASSGHPDDAGASDGGRDGGDMPSDGGLVDAGTDAGHGTEDDGGMDAATPGDDGGLLDAGPSDAGARDGATETDDGGSVDSGGVDPGLECTGGDGDGDGGVDAGSCTGFDLTTNQVLSGTTLRDLLTPSTLAECDGQGVWSLPFEITAPKLVVIGLPFTLSDYRGSTTRLTEGCSSEGPFVASGGGYGHVHASYLCAGVRTFTVCTDSTTNAASNARIWIEDPPPPPSNTTCAKARQVGPGADTAEPRKLDDLPRFYKFMGESTLQQRLYVGAPDGAGGNLDVTMTKGGDGPAVFEGRFRLFGPGDTFDLPTLEDAEYYIEVTGGDVGARWAVRVTN